LASELERILSRSQGLVQAAARERYELVCEQRLIPAATQVTVDEVICVEWPITVAILDDRRGTRAIVVDGVSGRLQDALGEQCTANVHVLTQHLGIPDPAARSAPG
jgi:hypothetical protein